MTTRIEQLKELARIIKDTPYALRTYLQTYDNTKKTYVPLDLFPDQIELLNDYENYNDNITKKYRQAGVSTITAAWVSKKLQIAKKEQPERVLIIANKRDTAIEMANKIRQFLNQWPDWLNIGFSPDKNSESRFKLNNGCEVKAVATSTDALRGYTPTILIFDEAAYIEAGEDFWAASMASLSCVHEDSYILTDNGLYQLKEIISEKNKIGFSKYNGNLKVINKDLQIAEIKNTFKSEISDCYKIKTKFGFELIGSYKHPILCKTLTGDEWVRLNEIKVGDNIKIQYNQNLFGTDTNISFPINHFNEKLYKLPEKLSDNLDLPYLMGLFVAEGSYSKNLIQICNGDKEIEDFLISLGFIKNRKDHFYLSSSHLKRFFIDYIGIKHTKAIGKKIPNYILKSSKQVIVSFLQGLFDGDGCAHKNGIKYSSISKELVLQLQILLSNFGIRTYIKYSEQKTSKNSILTNKNHITKIYDLHIKNEFVNKFYDEIGFRLNRKQEKKSYFINRIKNHIFIDATKDELKEILFENNITRKEYEANFRFLDGLMRNDKKTLTIHGYNKLIEKNLLNKKTLNIWTERFNNMKNFYYDDIVSVEKFKDETYDLEIPNGHSFISNSIISHNTGGKIILISTPNGRDGIYYPIYDQALSKMNNFKITELRWFKDPRYNIDLKWVKVDDIIHYMLNRQEYNDDEITHEDHGFENYQQLMDEGYKPYSGWFELMSKKLKYDQRKISQEIEGSFLGSGDNVIPGHVQENIVRNMIKEPTEKYMSGAFWVWKDPIPGHRYILAGDVSRGDSEDFSAISIIDFDEREQVAEYVGKIPPDDLASIIYKWGIMYSAFVVIDITGGMGVATSRKLQELGYKDMFIDGINVKNVWEYNPKMNDKIPGINFNNKRIQIVASFEEQLRNGFIVRSNRLMSEVRTFVYVNGRPDHVKGAHDDAIMALAMALYVGDISFSLLKRSEEVNRAMIDSWTVNERTYETKALFYSNGKDMDSVSYIFIGDMNKEQINNKSAYQEYSWLLGVNKKR